jgi:hypothetical protein
MTVCERLAELKRRPRSASFQEMQRLLVDAGFKRTGRQGATWVYEAPGTGVRVTLRKADPLLPAYVTRTVRVIERVVECDDID